MGLPREVLQTHGGRQASQPVGFQEPQDDAERGGVVGKVGEIDDAPVVFRDPDDVGGKAASASGMEEDWWGVTGNEPARGIPGAGTSPDRETKAIYGRGDIDEGVLLKGDDPFAE